MHRLVSGVLIAHPHEVKVHMWSAVRGVGEEERGGVKRRIESGERETRGALRERRGKEERKREVEGESAGRGGKEERNRERGGERQEKRDRNRERGVVGRTERGKEEERDWG